MPKEYGLSLNVAVTYATEEERTAALDAIKAEIEKAGRKETVQLAEYPAAMIDYSDIDQEPALVADFEKRKITVFKDGEWVVAKEPPAPKEPPA